MTGNPHPDNRGLDDAVKRVTVSPEGSLVQEVPPSVLVCHTIDPLMGLESDKGASEPGQIIPPPDRTPATETGLTDTVCVVVWPSTE